MTVQELIDELQMIGDKSFRLSYVVTPKETRSGTDSEQVGAATSLGWLEAIEVIEYHPDDREVELMIFV